MSKAFLKEHIKKQIDFSASSNISIAINYDNITSSNPLVVAKEIARLSRESRVAEKETTAKLLAQVETAQQRVEEAERATVIMQERLVAEMNEKRLISLERDRLTQELADSRSPQIDTIPVPTSVAEPESLLPTPRTLENDLYATDDEITTVEPEVIPGEPEILPSQEEIPAPVVTVEVRSGGGESEPTQSDLNYVTSLFERTEIATDSYVVLGTDGEERID